MTDLDPSGSNYFENPNEKQSRLVKEVEELSAY